MTVRVKAQPRARRPGLLGLAPGLDGPRLKIAVTEAPEDGRANRAVCAALARALGVPASAAEVAQGATAREKLVFIAGDPGTLAARIETLAPPETPALPKSPTVSKTPLLKTPLVKTPVLKTPVLKTQA